MKRCLTVVALVLLAPPCLAEAPEGWKVLFDGKSLDGWQSAGGKKPSDGWVIEEGALVRKDRAGDIWTKDRFGDFVLEMEFKTTGNSGIFFRTDKPTDCVQTGIEVQVDNPSAKPGKHSCGAVYDLQAPSKNAAKKGEWNKVVITARGSKLAVVMNDEPIVDMDLDRWNEPGKNPDGSKNKFKRALKDFKREGHIGLQDHGAAVSYRNIKVRPLSAEPDPAGLSAVRARMQEFVERGQLAGVVTVVGTSKGVVALDAVGSLDLEKKAPMPKDALFRIASMTKPITAIGIMILAEEGKLSVDDPVEKHLPEFKGQWMIAARSGDSLTLKRPKRAITLRDLLTHTSGLAGFPPGLADIYQKRHRTLHEMTLAVSQRPLEFEPGSKWAYCNSGIDALGRVIEVLSGQPYEVFLHRRVFEPLGMKDTACYLTPAQKERVAGLYDLKEGKLVVVPRPIIGPTEGAKHPIPAGGLYSTGPDLARLYQMMLKGGTLDGKRILSEDSVRTMTRLQTGDLECGFVPGMGFGYGWAVVKEPKGVTGMLSAGTYGHGGAFGTQAWLDPHKDLFVVLLIQRAGLPNGDASPMRHDLQDLAVKALGK